MKTQTLNRLSGVATHGSWPNYAAVFRKNEQARSWFEAFRGDEFLGLLDDERSAWGYENFVNFDVVQLMRVLTVQIWREQFAVSAT